MGYVILIIVKVWNIVIFIYCFVCFFPYICKQKIIINTNKNDYESFYFNTYLFPAFGAFDN